MNEHQYEEENRSLSVREAEMPLATTEQKPQITPAQARIESVAATLDSAYKNASTLKLTKEEAEALAADFPDEAFSLGAGGDPNLVYIEHAYLRQRLNQVLGVGAAVPIRRREWAENFDKGARVYVDLALVVRGCLVGEAIGDATYYFSNAKTTYSDALESAKSNAFRRCCKEFGVGLQAWMKGWCNDWKKRGGSHSKPRQAHSNETNRTPEPSEPEKPRQQAKASDISPSTPKVATAETRKWMIGEIEVRGLTPAALDYIVQKGWHLNGVIGLVDWPLEHVPTSRAGLAALLKELENLAPKPEPIGDEMPPEIGNAIITIPRKSMKKADYLRSPDTIGSLYAAAKAGDQSARNRLFGLAMEWECKAETGSDGTIYQPSNEDFQCRAALDAFLDWRESKEKTK